MVYYYAMFATNNDSISSSSSSSSSISSYVEVTQKHLLINYINVLIAYLQLISCYK